MKGTTEQEKAWKAFLHEKDITEDEFLTRAEILTKRLFATASKLQEESIGVLSKAKISELCSEIIKRENEWCLYHDFPNICRVKTSKSTAALHKTLDDFQSTIDHHYKEVILQTSTVAQSVRYFSIIIIIRSFQSCVDYAWKHNSILKQKYSASKLSKRVSRLEKLLKDQVVDYTKVSSRMQYFAMYDRYIILRKCVLRLDFYEIEKSRRVRRRINMVAVSIARESIKEYYEELKRIICQELTQEGIVKSKCKTEAEVQVYLECHMRRAFECISNLFQAKIYRIRLIRSSMWPENDTVPYDLNFSSHHEEYRWYIQHFLNAIKNAAADPENQLLMSLMEVAQDLFIQYSDYHSFYPLSKMGMVRFRRCELRKLEALGIQEGNCDGLYINSCCSKESLKKIRAYAERLHWWLKRN